MKIYQADVKHTVINPAWPQWSPEMGYNHDSDITLFKGRFICAWNANPHNDHEGKEGQYNYLSISEDFENWTVPVRPFSSEAGAENPVDEDAQWQPNFINYKNERLFCNWRGKRNGQVQHFVSYSDDGEHWVNTDQKNVPDGVKSRCAFPTQHGLLMRNGTMIFPSTLVENPFWNSHLCGILRSEDAGETWEWAEPVKAVTLKELGEDPEDYEGAEYVRLWEPVVYERPDGVLGLLVRHLAKPTFPCKPHHMILYAESRDEGKTWSDARPIEVDSVSTRMVTAAGTTSPDGLFMIMNDWLVNVPRFVEDRFYLSLYMAPVCDPDLLLPGPEVQQRGDIAYYPNGEVVGDTFYNSYSYGDVPREIFASAIRPMPDFSEPFLLPRARREPVQIHAGVAWFPEKFSSLGLVLTKELTENAILLTFRLRLDDCSTRRKMTLLTVGGKTRNGFSVDVMPHLDLFANPVDVEHIPIGRIPKREWLDFSVALDSDGAHIACEGVGELRLEGNFLRKISFGGLYETPTAHPTGCTFSLDVDSVEVRQA